MTEQQEAAKPKILIVEDEAIVAFDLKSGLEKLGYTVLAQVNSAEKALEMIEQDPPDLVLMDIVLKGKIDGIEAADIIHSRWGIPVVFCTSYADQKRLDRAKLVNPFGYILKPFQDNDLKVTVEMALYVSKVDRERRKAEEALRESEGRYRTLFEMIDEGFCIVEMLYDSDGKAVDYRFVEINPAFEKHTGLQQALGKTIRQMVPNHDAHWFEIYGKVARTGEAIRFENPATAMQRYYDVYAFRIGGDGSQRVGILFNDVTERKQVEKTLREKEENYRNLFENANEAILVAQDGEVVFLNPKTVMITGYSAEELVSRPFIEFIHPDDRDMVMNRQVKRLKGEKLPPIYDFRIIHKDSNVRWVELNAVVINWKGGTATLNFLSDITERKRAQKVLQESEERFRSLYEQAPLGYQSLDAKGCLIEVNQSWLDLLGYARQEVIGRRFSDFLAPQEVKAFKQRFPIFKAKGEVHVDLTMMHRSGSTIITHIDGKIGHDEHGRFKQTHCILHDITDRKQAETRLRESEEKYRSLASAEDSMYLVDRECRFRFMNQAHLSRFGLSLDEANGRSYSEFHSEEDSKQFASIVKEVFETNTSLQVEHRSEREPKYFLRTFSPVRDPQGSVTAVTVISKDITMRKQMEESLRSERNFAEGLINTAQVIILILDLEGRIVRFNPYMEKLSGYSLSEVQGKDWFSTFLPPQDQTKIKSLLLNL